jgi:predicted metal-dependent phosphoesterase TrpH
MARVDLHLHTTFSDGKLTPAELVALCYRRGLRVISISDHDSTEGLPEAFEAAQALGDMRIIPGIEFSTDIPGAEVHLLGYFLDWSSPELRATLQRFREGREGRAERMVERLDALGVHLDFERVKELSGGGAIGRPHIAQAMVEKGYVQYPREAFDGYLGRGGPAYVERSKLTPDEAIGLVLAYGGVPVMAHPTYSSAKPGREGLEDVAGILRRLKSSGLAGVEVYYGDYTPEQVASLRETADDLGLVPCGGSDYHASGDPGEPEPGSVGPPSWVVERLEEMRPPPHRHSGESRSPGAGGGGRRA